MQACDAEMSEKFWGAELKEVVSELAKEYDQCHTCWPTTVFSQGSLLERKVFCCSKFVRADGDKKMTSPEEDSGLFSGVRFFLAGFEPAYEKQFIEELEDNGGENAGTYDSSCSHVIVSNLAYDDPVCAAARKDGKALVTDAWVPDSLDNDTLADVNSVLYWPLKDLDGIPGSEDLCICLTGYQGQARQKIMRMVEMIGARFTKPLLGNLVTHLICYKFEGEKYELAKRTGLTLINHFWLEDCLKSWSLLPEGDYSRSGWEVETEAKQPKITPEKAEVTRTPVSQKKMKVRASATEEAEGKQKPNSSKSFQRRLKDPVEVSTSRRKSGIVEMDNSKCRSPAVKGPNTTSPQPSSLWEEAGEQERHNISPAEASVRLGEATVGLGAGEKIVARDWTSMTEGVECSTAIQGADIYHEALIIADQRVQMSPAHAGKSLSNRSSRRSSCGGANQVSPASPGFREVAAAADQCATIDSAMEIMNICADPPSKRRVSGGEGVEGTEPFTRKGAVDLESPESKRRKWKGLEMLSGMGLSTPVTKDAPSKVQDVVISPPVKQVSPPSVASVPSIHSVKQKLSTNEEEVRKGTGPSFSAGEATNREDAVLMEVTEPADIVISPGKKRLSGDSNFQAAQSKKVRDAPSSILYPQESLTNDLVEHSADDGASRDAETVPSKDTPERTAQPPKSSCAVGRDVDMEDVDHSPRSVAKSKKAAQQKEGSFSKVRKSVNRSLSVVPSKEQDEVELDSCALKEGDPFKDGPTEKCAKKVSWVAVSPPVSSPMLVLNETADGAGEHNVDKKVVEHDIPLGPAAVKQSAKKASKGSSSRDVPRIKSIQKNALPDQHNEGFPNALKQGDGLESSPAKQATPEEIQVPLSRPKKHHKPAHMKMVAVSSGEKEEEKTNEAGHHQEAPLKSSQEKFIKTPTQASISREKKLKGSCLPNEQDKENVEFHEGNHEVPLEAVGAKESCKKGARVSLLGSAVTGIKKNFAVGGSSDERKNLHYLIKLLGGKVCTNRYQWKDDTTHVVLPVPLRRTEKFLAGAAAGRWILMPEYVEACRKAGNFVGEEEYEWVGEGTNDKGTISLDAPRKWRLQFAKTGCGAFYGLRVVVYGACISPPLETLKRAIKAGGGAVLATTPPYSQHLRDGVDFAIINPGFTEKDEYVREFLEHNVACVMSDYFVDYICHPSSPLEKHILYKTHLAVSSAEKRLEKNIAQGSTEDDKFKKVASQKVPSRHWNKVTEDVACDVCRRTDDEQVMLLCGDGKGRGCGLATHIHCCSPPLHVVPDEDWFCRNCEDL